MKILFLFGLLAVVCGQLSPAYSFDTDETLQGNLAFDITQEAILKHADMFQIFRNQDLDGDGFVSLIEYKGSRPDTVPEEIIAGVFRFYDKLDGVIDEKFSFPAAVALGNILDINGDGVISLDEVLQSIDDIVDGWTNAFHEVYDDVLNKDRHSFLLTEM